MILIANSEAYPGIAETARQLQAGEDGLIASIEGIRLVESDPRVRTVGYGSWPNVLGKWSLMPRLWMAIAFVLARLVHSKALCILSMLPIAL